MSKKIEKLSNTSFSSNNEYLVYMFKKLIVCTIIMYLLTYKTYCFKKKLFIVNVSEVLHIVFEKKIEISETFLKKIE